MSTSSRQGVLAKLQMFKDIVVVAAADDDDDCAYSG